MIKMIFVRDTITKEESVIGKKKKKSCYLCDSESPLVYDCPL